MNSFINKIIQRKKLKQLDKFLVGQSEDQLTYKFGNTWLAVSTSGKGAQIYGSGGGGGGLAAPIQPEVVEP